MKSLPRPQPEPQLILSNNLSWEVIRTRINHWITDFEFCQFEIVFLQHILAKAAVWTRSHQSETSTTDLLKKVNNLELRRDLFARVIKYHRRQVEAIIENPFAYDGQTVRDDHQDLQKRIIEFMAAFRDRKFDVYLLVEDAIEQGTVPHLLEGRKQTQLIEYE